MIVIILLFNLYYTLLLLQQSSYHLYFYKVLVKKIYKKTYHFLLLFPMLYNCYISNIIIYVMYILIKIKDKHILKLKVTKRVCRITLINVLLYAKTLYLLYKNNININYILLLQIPYMLISLIILMPIEYIINNYYILKAKRKVKRIKPLVIGITGSFGKTTCKHILYEILKDKYIVFKTDKSYNTQMGITKNINQKLKKLTEIAIIEYGASQKNDIKKSLKVIKPDISLITNIQSMHLETFKTKERIIKEKTNLLKYSKFHVANSYDSYDINIPYQTFSLTKQSNIYAKNIKIYPDKTEFTVCYHNKDYDFQTNLLGVNNIKNILAVTLVCLYLNINVEEIKTKVKNIKQINNRLEVKRINNKIIIDDSYNANKSGFIEAINVLNTYKQKKCIVTCGVVSGGHEIKDINENIALKIINENIDIVLIKSNVSKIYVDVFKEHNYKYIMFDNIIKGLNYIYNSDYEVILIENDITDIYGG